MATDKRGRKLPRGIRQRCNNSFEGRFMHEGVSYTVYGNTVTETKKAMENLRHDVERGIYVTKEKILFSNWFNTWMQEYKKNQIKDSTYNSYQKYYGCVIKKYLEEMNIADIRGEHIQKLYNSMTKDGYALPTIKIVSAVLSGCMQQAVRNGLIDRNPVKAAILPRQKSKKTRQALSREQQALFMEYAKDSYLYNYFAVMLRTGLRNGEMRGLKYKDIDRKDNVLHIRRTANYIEGRGYYEDTPKTITSLRDIPLTEDIIEFLNRQRSMQIYTRKVQSIEKYIFCTETGGIMSRERVQAEIDRIIKRINADGIEFTRITPHVFRHTFATRAIEAGMHPQVLKTILGHSSLAMTMDLYSHVLPDTKAEAMEKIAKAF